MFFKQSTLDSIIDKILIFFSLHMILFPSVVECVCVCVCLNGYIHFPVKNPKSFTEHSYIKSMKLSIKIDYCVKLHFVHRRGDT